jgi:hypothetical protein
MNGVDIFILLFVGLAVISVIGAVVVAHLHKKHGTSLDGPFDKPNKETLDAYVDSRIRSARSERYDPRKD